MPKKAKLKWALWQECNAGEVEPVAISKRIYSSVESAAKAAFEYAIYCSGNDYSDYIALSVCDADDNTLLYVNISTLRKREKKTDILL
jgi:hypothetical protein